MFCLTFASIWLLTCLLHLEYISLSLLEVFKPYLFSVDWYFAIFILQ
jgi:hypothetical protein